MKRFFTIAAMFAATLMSFSQSLSYQDLGILFSQDDNNGSARFNAMSGAFGALGGDISTINVNPAGLSVFNNSLFNTTFNSRSTDITSNYYNNSVTTQDQFINLSQAGAVLVFDTAYNSEWSKFTLGFNYRITKDFNNNFIAKGNSGVATFKEFPLDTNSPKTLYDIADGQNFNNVNNGEISELNIAISSVHQKKIHLGLSLNFYDLSFIQKSVLTEFNSDANGNELDVELYQENITTGTGFSANAGFIYKAHKNFRFGLAYQTPTWYTEVLQDTNYNQDNDIDIGETTFFQGNQSFRESNNLLFTTYRLKTPAKLTASAALIFGKNGLLSIDYTNKNFSSIKLSEGDFSVENQAFQNDYRNTQNFNVGTEWRFDRFSIRGGYKFEQSPDKLALNSDNLQGYSVGGGYNFGNFKLDFSYSDNNRTSIYNFYPGFNVNPADLTLDNRVFTATLSLNL